MAPGSQGSLAAATVGDVSEELVLNLHSALISVLGELKRLSINMA